MEIRDSASIVKLTFSAISKRWFKLTTPKDEIERTKILSELSKNAELFKKFFQLMPQGEGSGLNADMVDDLHADEIIAKARTIMGGGGGGTPSLKHSDLLNITESDHHRKWYLADEGTWIKRLPHLPYGSWTKENDGDPIIPLHGSWLSAEDGCMIWDNGEGVFYIWYGGYYGATGNSYYRIGLCKFDPATLTTTYLNDDEPVWGLTGTQHEGVRYPSVIYDVDDGKYHMVFDAYDDVQGWLGLFHAESSDMINWTITPTSPIVSNMRSPSWIRLGDAVYLIAQENAWPPLVINAYVGKGATRYTSFTASDDNPILEPTAGEWDAWCVANPVIYWCFGTFYLKYDSRASGALPFYPGFAVDSSGFGTWDNARNGYRYRKLRAFNPVLDRGNPGKFDDAHVSIRDFCRIEDKFHALYAGHDGTRWQLGYLTLQ